MTDVRGGGVRGRLVDRGLSWELAGLDAPPSPAELEAAEQAAAAGGALDLRVRAASAPGGEPWTALGFSPLEPGSSELTRPVTRHLHGVEQTRALGVRLAAELRPGDLVVLDGPLGAGKTVLTRGIGSGLGVRGAVTSPTFVLAREHRGPLPLLHVDAYRLRDSSTSDVLADLDLEAALEVGVVVVEWGRGLVEDLADARLDVTLTRPPEDGPDPAEQRRLTVRAHGARWSVLSAPGGGRRPAVRRPR